MNLRIISRSIPLFLLLLITLILVLPSAQVPVKAASPVYMRPDGHDYKCDGSVDAAYPGGTGPLACDIQNNTAVSCGWIENW